MANYKRIALTAGLALAVVLLAWHSPKSKNISFRNLLQGSSTTLEEDLLHNKEKLEDTFKTLQTEQEHTKEKKPAGMDGRLEFLQNERFTLDEKLEQLKQLPADTPILKQLEYQFAYSTDEQFPPSIWQTWKQPKTGLEYELLRAVKSWDHKNPGYVHEVMSNDVSYAIVQHLFMNVPSVIEAYEALPEDILRADFFRYLILLARGGIYSDVDTKALKPVPQWIPSGIDPASVGLVVGIEADPDRPDWAEWYARRIQFCQWTIQAKPGHPVLRDIVARITTETLERKYANTLDLPTTKDRGSQIINWTGPGIWTDIVFEYFNKSAATADAPPVSWHNFTGLTDAYQVSDVMVLPITSFSPGVSHMGSRPETHPLAFVKHQFAGSWT